MKNIKLISLSLLALCPQMVSAVVTTTAGGVRWTHNSSTFVSQNWYGDPVLTSISDESLGGGYIGAIQSSALILDASSSTGYLEYSFDVNYTDITSNVALTYFAFPSTIDTLTVEDPDTAANFISHSYDATLSISNDAFTNSTLLGSSTDIEQYATTRVENRYTIPGRYDLLDGETYTMRVNLTNLDVDDVNVLYDDFFFQYVHTTDTDLAPEPSSVLLLGAGSMILMLRRTRKSK